MPRKKKDLLTSFKDAIADLGLPLDGLSIADLGLLASLLYTFYQFEKPLYDRAIVQAFLDYALIKSGTEIGVGSAVAHITGRGALEVLPEPVTQLRETIRGYASPWATELLRALGLRQPER